VENYLSTLTSKPGEASSWYSQNAELDWSGGPPGTPATRVLGKCSIHQFFKTIPELVFDPMSYDCHHIATVPPLTLVVLSGKAAAVGRQTTVHQFHTTMHMRLSDESRAAIVFQSFFLFTPSE
jgi:hypothetical protein